MPALVVADLHPLDAPLVLDTNIVLDWLVFRDPSSAALGRAILAERAHWYASQSMRDELEQVLTRPAVFSRLTDLDAILSVWDRWVRPIAPACAMPPPALRCTDPDDQKFIDLALQMGTATLLSRDRAVLRLARPARLRGVQILTAAACAANNSFGLRD